MSRKQVQYFVACSQGKRPYMEDTFCITQVEDQVYLFSIFDGHGGKAAAIYAANNITRILRSQMAVPNYNVEKSIDLTYMQLDEEICYECPSQVGCTALTAVLKDGIMYFSNCGDTMAIAHSNENHIVTLSMDHKADNERERVMDSGGFVLNLDGIGRVNGSLAIARALGDAYLKQHVISEPYHAKFAVNDTDWVVMASDGLWDVFDPYEIKNEMELYAEIFGWTIEAQEKFPSWLIDKAIYTRRSTDNITVILISFKHDSPTDQSFDLEKH